MEAAWNLMLLGSRNTPSLKRALKELLQGFKKRSGQGVSPCFQPDAYRRYGDHRGIHIAVHFRIGISTPFLKPIASAKCAHQEALQNTQENGGILYNGCVQNGPKFPENLVFPAIADNWHKREQCLSVPDI